MLDNLKNQMRKSIINNLNDQLNELKRTCEMDIENLKKNLKYLDDILVATTYNEVMESIEDYLKPTHSDIRFLKECRDFCKDNEEDNVR